MENTKGGSGDAGGIVTYHVINNPDPVPSQAKVKVEQAETVLDVSSELTALTSNSNQLPSSESEQLNSSRVQTLSRAGDGLVISSAIPTAPVVVTMASGRTLVTKSETVPEVALNTVVQTGNQHVVHQGRPLQNTVTPIVRKRSLETAQPGQVVTKVIITNNQRTSQPVAIPSRSISQGQIVLAGSSGAQAQHGLPRTITLTDSRSLSPHKVLSPNKRIVPAGKLPISPLKSPAKVTSLASLTKSPHKIIPSQMVTVMAKNLNTTNSSSPVTMTSSKTMITMSPTKLMVKGQPPVAIPIGSSASVLTGQRNVTSVKSGVAAAGTSEVHPQPVRGSKFQYVRLVTHPSSQATSGSVPVSRATSVTPAAVQPARHYLPVTAQTPSNQVKIAVPTQQQTISKPSAGHANQRLILPATSQVAIRPNLTPQMTYPPIQPNLTASSGSFPQLPPGTTLISSGQNLQGMQGFAIVPAQYVTQLQQQMSQQQFQQSGPAESSYTPITTNHSSVSSRSSINGPPSENQGGLRQRKPCNCTKSQCLKLYCDCFANGEFCSNCNCGNCYNNLEHEEERQRAIKSCLERNAHAFHPKIGKGRNGGGNRRHTKGCNCKRSGCLKNYCECYEAKILCSSLCKCVGCKNYEESPDRKTLMHLADAAEVRVLQQTAAKTKLSSQMEDLPPRPLPSTTGQKMPYTFVTTEVAEATCACLIAQAEEAERTRQIEMVQERMILEEFGRCLMQVVESANKTKAPSPLPMPDVTTET